MKRTIKIGVGLFLVLVVSVVAAIFFFVDSAAKAAVEAGATSALGVNTTLTKADVGILTGSFVMSGLNVDNPPGFTEAPFLTLGKGEIAVSLGSLLKDTIELPLLSLDALHIEIAQRKGKTNYGFILQSVQTDRTPASSPSASSKPAKTFIVHEVRITNVTARLSLAPIGGEPTVVTIPIDKIELKEVGADHPLPLSQLAGVIVQAVMSSVVENGGTLIPAAMMDGLTGSLANLGDLSDLGVTAVTELGQQAQELLNKVDLLDDSAPEVLQDAAQKVKKKLNKGLKKFLPGSGG